MSIVGVDISKWQGKVDFAKMAAAGAQFVYAKASQGASYRDPRFAENAAGAKAEGLKFGAYHFCTVDNALSQVSNFIAAIGAVVLDLTPALDVELDPATGKIISGSALWVMCDRMKGFQGHPVPAVYCSQSSGNTVWPYSDPRWRTMCENLLWVANWNVAKPALPDVWAKAGEPYYIWQDKLVPGGPYGVESSQIDHDVWGDKLPFPGDPIPPPPPPVFAPTANLSVWIDGAEWYADNVKLTKGV
jgi:lysozyme